MIALKKVINIRYSHYPLLAFSDGFLSDVNRLMLILIKGNILGTFECKYKS
jgi:hypothetical protein